MGCIYSPYVGWAEEWVPQGTAKVAKAVCDAAAYRHDMQQGAVSSTRPPQRHAPAPVGAAGAACSHGRLQLANKLLHVEIQQGHSSSSSGVGGSGGAHIKVAQSWQGQ